MASKINVNTIDTQSGNTITIPTGKTLAITDAGAFTIGGAALAVGSNTVRYETENYTIVGTDVVGKTECVVGAHAGGGDRSITLPLVTEAGVDTCMITVLCTQDAGISNYMKVVDNGGTELWRGAAKNDFARFIVMNGGWNIISHKETFFERRYLTSNQSIGGYTYSHMTGWTKATNPAAATSGTNQSQSIGNTWNDSGHEVVAPFDAWADIHISITCDSASETSLSPCCKVAGTTIFKTHAQSSDGRIYNGQQYSAHVPVKAYDGIQAWVKNNDDNGHSVEGDGSGDQTRTQFSVKLTQRY